MSIRLSTPRLRVVTGDPDNEDTWTEYEVRTIGPDIQATEELLGQLKRGTFGANPITAQAMLAYFALRRRGDIPPGTTWPDFQGSYLEVSEAGAEQPTPTPPAAGPAS